MANATSKRICPLCALPCLLALATTPSLLCNDACESIALRLELERSRQFIHDRFNPGLRIKELASSCISICLSSLRKGAQFCKKRANYKKLIWGERKFRLEIYGGRIWKCVHDLKWCSNCSRLEDRVSWRNSFSISSQMICIWNLRPFLGSRQLKVCSLTSMFPLNQKLF